jgi:hypothetical protein
MIIDKQERVLHTGGLQEKSGFKIAATAHMQQILSDGMYSDKIRAVIREVSCNALDAHTKVGNTAPIQVNLPTMLSPEFMVKDYGPGLSHEAVMELYTTYGHSDKGSSNELIGGLGLGSKSPFAYTDQFVIESRYQGKLRIYSCYKDEEGMMQIALLATNETDEANGLTIKVSVKHSDISTFKDKAQVVYKFFPIKPKINLTMLFEEEALMKGDGWSLFSHSSSGYRNSYSAHVQMGAVAYPIESSNFEEGVLTETNRSVINNNFILQLPIGSVQIAASREALSYTKATQKVIINALDKVAIEIVQTVQKEIDKSTCILDAFIKLTETLDIQDNNRVLSDIIRAGVTYKGTEIYGYYQKAGFLYYRNNNKLSSFFEDVVIKELTI